MKLNIASFLILTLFAFKPAMAVRGQTSIYGGGTTTTFSNIGSVNFSGETDQLMPTNNSDSSVTWGLALALRTESLPHILPQFVKELSIGPEFFYFQANTSGDIWQYGLSDMNNLTYNLAVTSSRLLGTNEITFQPLAPKAYPFFEWGLGFAANQSSYQETPRPTYSSPGLSLAKTTQYSFAYTLGGGLKIDISAFTHTQQPVLLTLRYLYANLGSADVSNQSNALVTSPISVDLYTQTWIAGLTYLF